MKVFLSWSGDVSRDVAQALHDWIPLVVQGAKPFVSAGDIVKGQRWSDVLSNELDKAAYGIICVTKGNLRSTWLHFESGAISKAIDKSYVSPFLFNVDPAQVQGPLQQFQFTVFNERDILSLIQSINGCLEPELRLTDDIIRREFDAWWPSLKERLDQIAQTETNETRTGYNWLYTVDDLAVIHHDDCKCIWWVTPDPYNYVLTPRSKDFIQKAVERGVQYVFVIPASEDMDLAKQALMHTWSKSNVHVIEIPSEEFRSAAITDYLVSNPDSPSAQVFLELPLVNRGYWVQVDQQAALGLVFRFRKLVNRDAAPATT